MRHLNSLSLIATAVFLATNSFSVSASQIDRILANQDNQDVSCVLSEEDTLVGVTAVGSIPDETFPKATIGGKVINIENNLTANIALNASHGIIFVGDSSTAGIYIKDTLSNSAVSATVSSKIAIDATEIYIDGTYKDGQKAVSVGNDSSIVIGSSDTNLVDISGEASAISGSNGNIQILGKNINLRSSTSDTVILGTSGSLTLGSEETEKIQIFSDAAGAYAALTLIGYSDAFNGNAGVQGSVKGRDVIINASGVGIWLQNGTEEVERPVDATHLRIEAQNLTINAPTGVIAFSNSGLDIAGNVEINSEEAALDVRGNSVVNVNAECSTCKTVINGDIIFETPNAPGDAQNSGKIINATVNLYLTGTDSSWTGRAFQYYKGSDGNPIENVELNADPYHGNVEDFRIVLKDGARWNVTGDSFVNVANLENGGVISIAEGVSVVNTDQVFLQDGVLELQGADSQSLNINKLTVTKGTVNIAAEIEGDGAFKTGQLSVGEVVPSVEEPTALSVNFIGITADDLSQNVSEDLSKLADQSLDLNGAGIAQRRNVAEGDIRGAVTQLVDDKGTVTSTSEASNTKLDVFKGVNASALVQWRNQVNKLTSRLGDVRLQQENVGAWARVYGGEYEWGNGGRVDMKSTTVQVGGDARVGDWIVGGAFSYSDSNLDFANGDGEGDLYSVAVYGTRQFEKGSYIDLVARYGYIKNDITTGNMSVDYGSNAFGLSVETGHTFKFLNYGFVEPQLEVSYGYAEGDDSTASNGVHLEQDAYQNLITRVGLRTGFSFKENAGALYAQVSYSYDFLGDVDGTASKDGRRQSLDEDLGGGWVTYGLGGRFRLGENTFAYGELERSTGGDVKNPWGFNVGVRHLF